MHRSLKLIFDGHTHEQLLELFHRVGNDRENRVVILTEAGDAFMDEIRPEGFDFFSPRGYDRIRREGRKVLMNILDIEAPVFTALNGPVRLHAEYELLTDIVLATVFQDKPDGVNLLRPQVVGSMRGRCFLLTGQELDPRTARGLGGGQRDRWQTTSSPGARARRPARGTCPANHPLHLQRQIRRVVTV